MLVAPAADAKAFRATVVKRNVAANTVVVATKAGQLRIVHNRRYRVGTVVRISGASVKAVGHTRRVRIKGVVTRPAARTFNLSAGGAVLSVRARGGARATRRPGHRLGLGVDVRATIAPDGTVTETVSTETDDVDGAQLKGTLTCTPASDAVTCDQPNTLKIDVGPVGAPLLIPVVFDPLFFPDTLLGPLVGQRVQARVDLAPSTLDPGAVVLTLKAIASEDACRDEDEDEDEDEDNDEDANIFHRDGDDDDGCEDDD